MCGPSGTAWDYDRALEQWAYASGRSKPMIALNPATPLPLIHVTLSIIPYPARHEALGVQATTPSRRRVVQETIGYWGTWGVCGRAK